MPKYNLTCDNGQVMEMNVITTSMEVIVGEEVTIVTDPIQILEAEIAKLVQSFPVTPANGEPWPAGWPNPLPTSIASWELIG